MPVRRPAPEAELKRALEHLPRDKSYLVGVSGGRDSMALLHALVASGFNGLVVCHLDHGLRGEESLADAEFVLGEARKFGLATESARVDTARDALESGRSLELAARELRHRFFHACAGRRRCRRLFLAHHADDQVETCLFQFLRGSGAAGLAGMRTVSRLGRLAVIRPLLGVSRATVDEYVRANGIAFREDASNLDPTHTRNRLRHDVLPAIEEAFGPSFRSAILRASGILRMESDWLDTQVPELLPVFPWQELRALHPALRHRAVRRWLRSNGVPEPGLQETRRVLSLLDVENGPAKVSLPGKAHARRRGGMIFLEREGR